MQLTLDTGVPIDIEFKMSTVKGATLNEMIINNVDETFSDDVKNSSLKVKDYTSDTVENNDKLQNSQLDDNISQDDVKTSDSESTEVEKSTSEESSMDDCESKSFNPKSSKNELSIPEDIVNNDSLINQYRESDSQSKLSNHNTDEKANEIETDTTEKLDNGNSEQKSNVFPKPEIKDQIIDNNINTTDHEDTTNDSKTDNNKIIENEIVINDMEPTSNDTNNVNTESSNVKSVIDQPHNEDNDENKAIEPGSTADSTLENTPKDDDSTKENEIPQEPVASDETDTKCSTIEVKDANINETTTHNDKDCNEKVYKVVEEEKKSTLVSKLTNILDLLSDEEEERPGDTSNNESANVDKQCISLVDDDDVMLIDEDTIVKEDAKTNSVQTDKVIPETCDENTTPNEKKEAEEMDSNHESGSEGVINNLENNILDSKSNDVKEDSSSKPLLSLNFLNNCKKTLADMTREDLEDFCSLKIVESVMDRSNLGDLKTQLKTMAVTIEEFKKKTNLLFKQNRDLQIVLKAVQEEQKKSAGTAITPLKITRSVGMQVLMTDKPNAKRKNVQITNHPSPIDKTNRNHSVQKVQKTKTQPIPVPRLVPAANTSNKTSSSPASNIADHGKSPQVPPLVNGVRNTSPAQKPEKRSRVQSVTVDLTDDEPPLKVTAKSSPAPGVRLVPAQNLLPPQRPQFAPAMTSPRKVYIPISGQQSQNVRPGQTVLLKTVPPSPGLRPRMPANNVNKVQPNTIRMNRPVTPGRHPAPLPDAVKQYQPTSWKALPPAPDLKLSKVENGIVISWKIDGYQEDSYEEITSYQLFAYQETNCPPSTALWKKIGDVKALPLPMACTLTQFLAGFKYYFAVRAVDIKSRFGPFSLPASILLLNKM